MSIKFGVQLDHNASIQDLIQSAQLLEKLNFDSIWFSDHLVALDRKARCLDPWPIMASLASCTSRIALGSMVTDPFRRHPAVFAQTLATVDWISGGRLKLGIGAGEAMNIAPFNIPWDHRALRLEEYIKILRMLWTGRTIDFHGRFFKLDKAFIQALPCNRDRISIYIAANSPTTRKIVGQLGDGWIAEMLSPEYYEKDLREVDRALTEVGRDSSNIDVTYHVLSAISENSAEAKSLAHQMAREMFTYWPKQLERYGHKISDACDWNRLIVDENSLTEVKELSKSVPEDIADLVTISGNVDECIGKIEDYIVAGVNHFAFSFGGTKDKALQTLGEKIIPYFRCKIKS